MFYVFHRSYSKIGVGNLLLNVKIGVFFCRTRGRSFLRVALRVWTRSEPPFRIKIYIRVNPLRRILVKVDTVTGKLFKKSRWSLIGHLTVICIGNGHE